MVIGFQKYTPLLSLLPAFDTQAYGMGGSVIPPARFRCFACGYLQTLSMS